MSVSQQAIDDLAASGLTPEDMNVRDAGMAELGALGIQNGSTAGYVIPYYDISGKSRSFYRVKLFNAQVKYRQPKNTSNSLYFPPKFKQCLEKSLANNVNTLILCEGEKKAACCVANGFPAVSVGGVDSWRNRILQLPEGVELGKSYGSSAIQAKVPAGTEELIEGTSSLASGMKELIDLVIQKDLNLVICYDTDNKDGVKFEVQRAAAALAYKLKYEGLGHGQIHQMVLPVLEELGDAASKKVGLDDFIVERGAHGLECQIGDLFKQASTFPANPNIRGYLSKKLQKTKMSRGETIEAATALLCELDCKGQRLRCNEEQQMYYYDSKTLRLMKVSMNSKEVGLLAETEFGHLLYQRYGIGSADGRVLSRLVDMFNSDHPIADVKPHRVLAKPGPNEDIIRFQISDGSYVKIDGRIKEHEDGSFPITVLQNGDEGFMFEAGLVEPTDGKELLAEIERQRHLPLTPWWREVLSTVRLKDESNLRELINLLYYVSPWLYKWRDSQLPIELVIGEAGSGKSSLCEHRLNILTGNPKLRNAPSKMSDWLASITNAGGLHVIDNMNLSKNAALAQSLSDEICRLITESDPHVEMRKLYSNNELVQTPVKVVFCMTAIQQPFQQGDLLQRAMLIELDKSGNATNGQIMYEYSWVDDQMTKFGGRTAWLAHQLIVLKRYFDLVREEWNPHYSAQHRLKNLEQSLVLMARVFDPENKEAGNWIPGVLAHTTSVNAEVADPFLKGLKAFAASTFSSKSSREFDLQEVVDWCKSQDEFEDNAVLIKKSSLIRHVKSRHHDIAQIAKIEYVREVRGNPMYIIKERPNY